MIPLRHLVIGLVAAGVCIYVWDAERTKTQYAEFKAHVRVLGEAAEKETKRRIEHDRKLKEKADAENTKLRADLAAADKRLRDERARRSRVPAAPAGSRRPDLATFDRAELERAMAHLDERGADIARKGTEAAIDLDTAKRWAKDITPRE